MALSADEQKLLDELTARAAEPDPDSDFEIEIFNGERGARIPFSKGAQWLADNFGIGLDKSAGTDGDADGGGEGKKPPTAKKDNAGTAARGGYFVKKPAGK